MPKKTPTASSAAAAFPSSSKAAASNANKVGLSSTNAYAQMAMTPFNTTQLMGMAALAAASGLAPSFSNATSGSSVTNANIATATSTTTNANANSLLNDSVGVGGIVANLDVGSSSQVLSKKPATAASTAKSSQHTAASYYQACANFNMAASVLAQMSMGMGYDSQPSSTNSANSGLSTQSKINAMVLQKIQALVAANPQFLTSGIPNQLLSQLLMQPMKVSSMIFLIIQEF
ncbi:protein strawberry notch [Lucilia cuprina]|uniref:protein strawberry notch n=1 Tax=Lucilia cuprina TaxID=7375 RepID=UPI001F05318D|nr:protein strawberry notch [Lucilia cuprina]